MKIAMPVVGNSLSPHFGHCEHFTFFDIDENNKITGRTNIPSPEHQPGLLPVWVSQQGANVIIAGGMGPMAVQLFEQNGVHVVLGAQESDPEKAVLSYLNNSLATSDNSCDHGDGGHECHH